jgi:hypothetical protein
VWTAERFGLRHADAAKEPDERHLTRAQPVDGHREQHDKKNQRDECEVHGSGSIDAQRATEAVRLDHPEDLNRDGAGEHVRQLAVKAAVSSRRGHQAPGDRTQTLERQTHGDGLRESGDTGAEYDQGASGACCGGHHQRKADGTGRPQIPVAGEQQSHDPHEHD